MINNTINETITAAVVCVGNCTWEVMPNSYKWLLTLAGIILYLFVGWLTLKLAICAFGDLEADDPQAFAFGVILLWPAMLLVILLFCMLHIIKVINYLFQLEEEIDELKNKINELTNKIKKERSKKRKLKNG